MFYPKANYKSGNDLYNDINAKHIWVGNEHIILAIETIVGIVHTKETEMTRTTISFDDYDPSDLNAWDDILPYIVIIDECVGEDESPCPVSIDEIQNTQKSKIT